MSLRNYSDAIYQEGYCRQSCPPFESPCNLHLRGPHMVGYFSIAHRFQKEGVSEFRFVIYLYNCYIYSLCCLYFFVSYCVFTCLLYLIVRSKFYVGVSIALFFDCQ